MRGNLARTRFHEQEIQLRQPDAVGNLFRTEARTDRRYGTAGQLLEADGTRYTYDALGNLIHKLTAAGQEWTYAWNGAGRLANVLRPDGQRVEFKYDALGRRISKRYRGQVTRWVWDGHVPLHEWRESEAQTDANQVPALITWVFEGESFVPAAKLTAQGASSIACDHLGTPLSMYDGQGRQTWELELDSYGAGAGAKPKTAPFATRASTRISKPASTTTASATTTLKADSTSAKTPLGCSAAARS